MSNQDIVICTHTLPCVCCALLSDCVLWCQGLVCDASGLLHFNTCASLDKAFPSLCVQCRESFGLEQPVHTP